MRRAALRSPRRISSMRLPWLRALTQRRDRATSRHRIAGVDIGAAPLTRKPRRRAPLISIEPATFIGKLHIRFGLAPSITESCGHRFYEDLIEHEPGVEPKGRY